MHEPGTELKEKRDKVLGKVEGQKAVIFDIDGTMANLDHRLVHLESDPPDHDKFNENMIEDEPIHHIIELFHMYKAKGYFMIICTARSGAHLGETRQWLGQHEIHCDLIMMRDQTKDPAIPDAEVKLSMLKSIRSHGYEPILAVEDRSSVVRMWRDNGVPCLQVDDGDF